jgi:nanoRNase/pAp phosphatase (c-di-AMP/oligoRNAs hydrolase)
MAEKTEEMKQSLSNIDAILIHNFPDPDAISSALGISQYVKMMFGKSLNIYYTGEISHPQNKSMLTLLNINLYNYEETPLEKNAKVALVDTNNVGEGSNQPVVEPENVQVTVVIDHHKGNHPKGAKVDCRYVGATASIIWDYLREAKYNYEGDEGELLATALVVGITTDTDSLLSDNTTDIDFQAYQDLRGKADKQKLNSIMKYPLPPYLFDLRHRAFLDENRRIEEGTVVSGIGVISPTKRDALPIIAEEFLRMSGITTTIVFAVIDDYVDISVRSKDITCDVGPFLQKVFNAGGGKRGEGGARIPLGYLKMDGSQEYNDKLWELIKETTFSKVFSRVKGE